MPDSSQGDQTLNCVDCGAQFTFSARDQQFYQERGYQAPRRCKTCRDKRKASGGGGGGGSGGGGFGGGGGTSGGGGGNRWPSSGGGGSGGGSRRGSDDEGNAMPPSTTAPTGHSQFKVLCSGCGVETTVPFKPDPNRPVYCRTCYLNKRKA
jgi:CxxC-x17-CxxC domain-containing protein